MITLSRLYLLPHYCRTLGTWRGFRYWLISNRCAKDPNLVLKWAAKRQREASNELRHGNEKTAQALLSWADELRKSHAAYTLKPFKSAKKPIALIRQRHPNGCTTVRNALPKSRKDKTADNRLKRNSGQRRASDLLVNDQNEAKAAPQPRFAQVPSLANNDLCAFNRVPISRDPADHAP